MVEKSMVVCLGSVRCGSRLSCGFVARKIQLFRMFFSREI
jgi:hypothetical protein